MIEFPLETIVGMISAVGANCPQPCKLPEEQASMKDKNSFYPTPLTELNANDALK